MWTGLHPVGLMVSSPTPAGPTQTSSAHSDNIEEHHPARFNVTGSRRRRPPQHHPGPQAAHHALAVPPGEYPPCPPVHRPRLLTGPRRGLQRDAAAHAQRTRSHALPAPAQAPVRPIHYAHRARAGSPADGRHRPAHQTQQPRPGYLPPATHRRGRPPASPCTSSAP